VMCYLKILKLHLVNKMPITIVINY